MGPHVSIQDARFGTKIGERISA